VAVISEKPWSLPQPFEIETGAWYRRTAKSIQAHLVGGHQQQDQSTFR
jgi:hypothetical protein